MPGLCIARALPLNQIYPRDFPCGSFLCSLMAVKFSEKVNVDVILPKVCYQSRASEASEALVAQDG